MPHSTCSALDNASANRSSFDVAALEARDAEMLLAAATVPSASYGLDGEYMKKGLRT